MCSNARSIDTYVSIENRDGLFPIHRGLKFLLICAAAGLPTASMTCRFGVRSPDVLDQIPDTGPDPLAVTIERGLLERMGGPQLPIPELRTKEDIDVAATIAFGVPALGAPEGWAATFGRELNATDDRRHFSREARRCPSSRASTCSRSRRCGRRDAHHRLIRGGDAAGSARDVPARAARLSRRGLRVEPAHAHCRGHSGRRRDDAHDLLPEG